MELAWRWSCLWSFAPCFCGPDTQAHLGHKMVVQLVHLNSSNLLVTGQCVFQLWLGIIWELLEVTMAWWVGNCISLGFSFPAVPTLKDRCHSHYESMAGSRGWSCEDSVASLLDRGSPALHLPNLSLPPNSSSLSHHQALCKVYIILVSSEDGPGCPLQLMLA